VTRIGVTLPQFTDDAQRFTDGARAAIEQGFDSVWVFDHLWPLGGKRERPILECWTSLAHLAATTDRVEIGTLVTRSSLRNQGVLVKMAATVGTIAPGRTIIGLGSGDAMNRSENEAFGAPFYSGKHRTEQLVATLEVLLRGLKTGRATHGQVDLPLSPQPAEPVRVWLGGRSVEVLEVAGRIADGWNGWGANLDAFALDAAKVKSVAGTRAFQISWAGQVIVAENDAAARDILGDRDPAQFVTGSPETVRGELAKAIEAGATHLIVALPQATPEAYSMLAAALAPLH
jgi:alkanesulfonate monooxygenase SsuD/methylene tetrahydromethanopterin reductase-like flavin-dependent oxidoreductase (luciferase family)